MELVEVSSCSFFFYSKRSNVRLPLMFEGFDDRSALLLHHVLSQLRVSWEWSGRGLGKAAGGYLCVVLFHGKWQRTCVFQEHSVLVPPLASFPWEGLDHRSTQKPGLKPITFFESAQKLFKVQQGYNYWLTETRSKSLYHQTIFTQTFEQISQKSSGHFPKKTGFLTISGNLTEISE